MTGPQPAVGTVVAAKGNDQHRRLSHTAHQQQRTPLRRRERFFDDQAARDLDDVACCVSGCSGGNLTIRGLADREWDR
jgi:hypothetical protein